MTEKEAFRKYFDLDYEKYRDEGLCKVFGKEKIDIVKFYDYMSRKHKFAAISLHECLIEKYGEEAAVWFDLFVFGDKSRYAKMS